MDGSEVRSAARFRPGTGASLTIPCKDLTGLHCLVSEGGRFFSEANRWHRLAADQGHSRAQFSLGYLQYSGEGVPKDLAESVRWYSLAADQLKPAGSRSVDWTTLVNQTADVLAPPRSAGDTTRFGGSGFYESSCSTP